MSNKRIFLSSPHMGEFERNLLKKPLIQIGLHH